MGKESFQALFGATNKGASELFIEDLVPYENQPFALYSDAQLKRLAEDIREHGLYHPIRVRHYRQAYQIISGHNRYEAIKRYLDWMTIPATIEDLTDEQAAIELVNSNFFQRTTIKESEKVKAYTLKSEAIKQQGVKGNNTAEVISKQEGISKRQLARYLACSKLIEDFLELLDKKKINVAIGEQLAKLPTGKQEIVYAYMINHDEKIKLDQAIQLRELDAFTDENLATVFHSIAEEIAPSKQTLLEKAEAIPEIAEHLELFDRFEIHKLFELIEKYGIK